MRDRPIRLTVGSSDEASLPLVIATILREEGITGVHTHVRQLRRYLEECGTDHHPCHAVLVGSARSPYPFSALASFWSDAADPPASSGIGIGMRCSSATRCADTSPRSATASSMPRDRWPPGQLCVRGEDRHQRVIMAVHFRVSRPTNGPIRSRSSTTGRYSEHSAGRTGGDPAGRRLGIRLEMGSGCAGELAAGGRGSSIRRHRQLRGSAAPPARSGAARGPGHHR